VGDGAAAHRLVLASGSPRRRELLGLLGVPFDVVSPDVDESPFPGERPTDHVLRIASAKANVVARRRPESLVLAADTVVDLDDRILGKPVDAADAARMLRALSGREHQVHTGVVVADDVELVTTVVRFDELFPADVERYVATGEPLDKAGAYAIQGAGAAFVREVRGSVTNVIGLPLAEVRRMLIDAGHAFDPAR
jgi:septum formation protein